MAKNTKESFHAILVLNQWLLSLFGERSFQPLQERLKDESLEGRINQHGNSFYCVELERWWLIPGMMRLSENELRRYDFNISKHWSAITERRNVLEDTVMNLKYFQYLSLLFTEIYLDWFFNKPEQLLKELNTSLSEFNTSRKSNERFQPFCLEDLNKIAFWNATGSGKTLLLHVNIQQYREYFKARYGNRKRIDKTILLTPNEGLSRQHLEELELSGMDGIQFNKNHTVLPGYVEVIDINKLGDEDGDKVVAVENFEGHNLVLIDEGHRGTGKEAGAWLKRRESLCGNGFSFEYSATFGQSVSKSKTVLQSLGTKQPTQANLDEARTSSMKELYAKCVLFDYSYKFFYEDGYGKESLILNLAKDNEDETRQNYLTACLLSFFQQQWLFRTHQDAMAGFSIEKPLWIFVGNKVNDDDSDVLEVLRFLARFVNSREKSVRCIEELKADQSRLLDNKNRSIFEKRFLPLSGLSSNDIFSQILKSLFNADSQQRLKVILQKGGGGELALQLGTNEPFGVINIGDAPKFLTLCKEEVEFDADADEFGKSLFGSINKPDSTIHLLVGSRKFSEGWSSWRVSTMGLMNMGRGEGSQIIQLFGRGVRLKGRDYSLKRSRTAERPKGVFLDKLETLNIFGIRADYMAQFKDYLREEGITPSDEMLEVSFETKRHAGNGNLKTLAIKDGYKANQKRGFKRNIWPELFHIPDELQKKIKPPHVKLDLYPRIQAMHSTDSKTAVEGEFRRQGYFGEQHLAFMDFDRIYRDLVDYKNERSWFNLRISKESIVSFCTGRTDWYTLLIPTELMEFRHFDAVRKWEAILLQLLKGYAEKFYDTLKQVYEEQFYEYITLDDENDNFIKVYNFDIDNTDEGLVYQERLNELKRLVESGELGQKSPWNCNNMVAIRFDCHLYYPLIHINGNVPLKMRPLSFDAPSEVQFVKDLEAFYNSTEGQKLFKNRSLYLMRNSSVKSKGVGFSLAGNFYPDFLLWIVEKDRQYLSFIDPKGLRQVDLDDPKLQLYKEIKTYEKKLADPGVTLNSFILSDTKFLDLLNNPYGTPKELADRHVLFLEEGGDKYLPKMFERILSALK